MVKACVYLIGQGYDDQTILPVIFGWWHHFENQGTIRTPVEEAPQAVANTIRALRASGTIQRARGTDHAGEIAKISLSQSQTELITAILTAESQSRELNPIHTVVTTRAFAFVEALTVHCLYEQIKAGEGGPLKMTGQQIIDIVEARTGIALANMEIERLKRQFLTDMSAEVVRLGRDLMSDLEIIAQILSIETERPVIAAQLARKACNDAVRKYYENRHKPLPAKDVTPVTFLIPRQLEDKFISAGIPHVVEGRKAPAGVKVVRLDPWDYLEYDFREVDNLKRFCQLQANREG
ncbi:hypothetical protein HK102_008425 [Quaeritorhiza haematococci]|nr:hypothetical protein HK102_008425 [Quaeritorhiza haematococci]